MKKKSVPSARAHVHFSGRVQGVGFRHTAEGFALEIGLTGWVKNLPDGRVEMLCEGPKEKIEGLLERIRTSFLGAHVKKADVRWAEPTGEFEDFTVEFTY